MITPQNLIINKHRAYIYIHTPHLSSISLKPSVNFYQILWLLQFTFKEENSDCNKAAPFCIGSCIPSKTNDPCLVDLVASAT